MAKKSPPAPPPEADRAEIVGIDLFAGNLWRTYCKLDDKTLAKLNGHLASGYVRIIKALSHPINGGEGYTHLVNWPGLGLLIVNMVERFKKPQPKKGT